MLHVRFLADSTTSATVFANQGQLLLNVLIGVVLPMLVALVTHRVAAEWLKGLLLLALSVLGGLLATISVADFHWKDFLAAFVVQFGTAVVAHFGALKPLGVTGSQGVIQQGIPGGLGASSSPTNVGIDSSR